MNIRNIWNHHFSDVDPPRWLSRDSSICWTSTNSTYGFQLRAYLFKAKIEQHIIYTAWLIYIYIYFNNFQNKFKQNQKQEPFFNLSIKIKILTQRYSLESSPSVFTRYKKTILKTPNYPKKNRSVSTTSQIYYPSCNLFFSNKSPTNPWRSLQSVIGVYP